MKVGTTTPFAKKHEILKKEKEKNMNAVVELIAFLTPLLSDEQNDRVREITNKIIND